MDHPWTMRTPRGPFCTNHLPKGALASRRWLCEECSSYSYLPSSSFSDVSGVVCPVCVSTTMSDLDLESVLQKHLEILANQTLELFDHEHVLAAELDALFLVVISIMIFIMQCGFAFLEAGSVRGV